MHAIIIVNMPKAPPETDVSVHGLPKCACSQLRRAGRRVTQLYDQALEPAGLTIGQFGLLAHLAATSPNGHGIAIGALAEARGMDPTTLTRNLKPLVAKGWIVETHDRDDRRVRALMLSPSGRKKFLAAGPLWQSAQAQLQTVLGEDILGELLELLEVSIDKLA
jgi:DNA-binding MarR family transcriptional regulator